MPYRIRKEGSRWYVYNMEKRQNVGSHPNKESAQRQARALYAKERKKK